MSNTSRSTMARRRRQRNLRRKRLRRRKFHFAIFSCVTILSIIIVSAILFFKFTNSHFSRNTLINGIDCSWLTPEDAYNKLNDSLSEKTITFLFEDNSHEFDANSLDFTVASIGEMEDLLVSQRSGDKQTNFSLNSFYISKKALRETLQSLPELNEENMLYSQNAYVTLDDNNLLTIVPEVIGNYINFDEAYNLAYETLSGGCTTIDLRSLTVSKPEITSEDLQENVDSINNILKTTITFNISEDSSLTLDKSVMKDWLVEDENGNYSIDIDSNLPDFVNNLSNLCSNSTVYVEFEATGIGTVTVPAKNLSINKEAEINLIKSELGSATSYDHTPLYNINIGGTYVEIDIARQHVWLYVDGICIMETDCVTGNKGNHDTREGYFFLTSKETDRILRGYNDNGSKYASHVDFWMPFDGGIGLHDAAWRHGAFGGDIYLTNGSHGCVNLPRWAAETIYNNIDFSTPIIVYCSAN